MGIDQRIPDLSDGELERLHANAIRLAQSGTPVQREQAEALLPLLGGALEARRVRRVAASRATRRSDAERKAVVGQGSKEKPKESPDE